MRNLFYLIAAILILVWAIGYLGFNVGGFLHVLLVIAFVLVIQRVIQERKAD
ncbi:MAG: lmo0937 family membrane protein [Bacteroidales bacterium]|nr:MAG: lmo0937 family membrane protein [Bacteroidales bacterium]